MTDRMIMSSNRELTFMYRVGGIAVYEGHLLVERNVKHDFCFVSGGRVEYGENAIEALTREVREELGEEVRVSRLVLVADNLFKLDNDRFQEVALHFLVEFAPGSKILDRDCRCSTIMSVSNWSAKMSSHGRIDIDAEGADETSGAQQRSGRSGAGMSGGRGPESERTPHEAYSGGL